MAHRIPLADIQFIADFAAFCRGRGDEEYGLGASVCALAQFGRQDVFCDDLRGIPEAAYMAAVYEGAPTFAALAARLEALIAHAPVVVTSGVRL